MQLQSPQLLSLVLVLRLHIRACGRIVNSRHSHQRCVDAAVWGSAQAAACPNLLQQSTAERLLPVVPRRRGAVSARLLRGSHLHLPAAGSVVHCVGQQRTKDVPEASPIGKQQRLSKMRRPSFRFSDKNDRRYGEMHAAPTEVKQTACSST